MNNELYHYGVLGMKWGVRRYQNPDGTLTDAGKKKYLKPDGTLSRSGQKARKKWNQNVDRNWYKAYNNATHIFNNRLDTINNKYKGVKFDSEFSTKEGQKYIKEVSKMWKDLYTSELIKMFGANEITNGREYVENMPLYFNYDGFIIKN